MITPEMLARINALAKKSREDGLTDAEREEQTELRRHYIEHIRTQVKSQLDSIKFVEDEEKTKCNCNCPDHHHHH